MKIRGSGSFREAITQAHAIAKDYDAPIVWFIIMLVVYACTTVVLPLITVYVIDALVLATNFNQFIYLAALFFATNIIKAALRTAINIYISRREYQYSKKLEKYSLSNFLKRKGEFYTNNKTGDMMEIIMDDNMQVAAFTYQVYRTTADLINSFAIISILFYLQWDLVLILLSCLPFILVIQNNLEWKLDNYYSEFREEMAKENSLTEEFVSNAMLIVSHGMREKCQRKYEEMLSELVETYRKTAFYSHTSYGTLEGFIILTISAAVLYEGYNIFTGTATIGVLVAFIQYSDFLIEPGRSLAALRVQGNKLIPSMARVKSFYYDNLSGEEGSKPEFEEYDIVFNHVNFGYADRKEIFHDVCVKMQSGKTHIILGASGLGKSTMINLITKLWDVETGEISIGGRPIDTIQEDYLRKHIALVSQDNLFFNDTIKSNLMETDNQYTEKELYSALKKAGIMNEVLAMPRGLDTELGDKGYKISGGQRQRLAIARAILKNAPIVIFDEATSALDEETEKIILNTIKDMRGKTILVITHRKSMIEIGDYIYEIRDKDIQMIR